MFISSDVHGNVTLFAYVLSDLLYLLTFIRIHNFSTILCILYIFIYVWMRWTQSHKPVLRSKSTQHWHMHWVHTNINTDALKEFQGKRSMGGQKSLCKEPQLVQFVYMWKKSLQLTTSFISHLFQPCFRQAKKCLCVLKKSSFSHIETKICK